MPNFITVQCKDQPRSIATVWLGDCLAVHRPTINGSPSKQANHWAITHIPSGLAVCLSFNGTESAAIGLAKDWDAKFSTLDVNSPRTWPLCKAWGKALQLAQFDTGCFDAYQTLPRDRVKTVDGWVQVLWRRRWWPVPSDHVVEDMIFDSVAETPDGRTVEPDHPESWLSILKVI